MRQRSLQVISVIFSTVLFSNFILPISTISANTVNDLNSSQEKSQSTLEESMKKNIPTKDLETTGDSFNKGTSISYSDEELPKSFSDSSSAPYIDPNSFTIKDGLLSFQGLLKAGVEENDGSFTETTVSKAIVYYRKTNDQTWSPLFGLKPEDNSDIKNHSLTKEGLMVSGEAIIPDSSFDLKIDFNYKITYPNGTTKDRKGYIQRDSILKSASKNEGIISQQEKSDQQVQETTLSGLWGTVPYAFDPISGTLTLGGPNGTNGTLGLDGTQPWKVNPQISNEAIKKIIVSSKIIIPFRKSVISGGPVNQPSDSPLFSNLSNLTAFDGGAFLDFSAAGNIGNMFSGCSSLTTIDVSKWNISNISDMNSLFMDCANLTTLDVSEWNFDNATSMYSLFSGCSKLATLDVSKWKMPKLKSINLMFANCTNLSNLNVSEWDTSSMTSMSYVFAGCSSLSSLDVSRWNTFNVTDMSTLFSNCSSLSSLNVSGWDTSNVKNMSNMFVNVKLNSLNVSKWNTSNVVSMDRMFSLCTNLSSLDVSKWDVSNVTSMSGLFQNCIKLSVLDVSKWQTANVTNMDTMFGNCRSISSLDVSNWNTLKVTDMTSLFSRCTALWKIKFGQNAKFNTSAGLPEENTTVRWRAVGSGSEGQALGTVIGPASALMQASSSGLDGVYVKETSAILSAAEASGSPATQSIWSTINFPLSLSNDNSQIVIPTKMGGVFKGWSMVFNDSTTKITELPSNRIAGQKVFAFFLPVSINGPKVFNFGVNHSVPNGLTTYNIVQNSEDNGTDPTIRVTGSDDPWNISVQGNVINDFSTESFLKDAYIQFNGEMKEGEDGSLLPIPNGQGPTLNSSIYNGNKATIPMDGTSQIFMTADQNKGLGTWSMIIDPNSIQLTVPYAGKAGQQYKGSIDWTLDNTP